MLRIKVNGRWHEFENPIFILQALRRLEIELPTLFPYITTPLDPCTPLLTPTGNSGYFARICAVLTVDAVPFEVGNPRNGFGVVAVSREMAAWSRTGDVLRNCRGMPLNRTSFEPFQHPDVAALRMEPVEEHPAPIG